MEHLLRVQGTLDKPQVANLAPYAALIAASILWGSLYTAGKPAVAATGPVQVTLCRAVLACLCLGPLAVARAGPQVLGLQLRRHWRAIITLGLVNFTLSQILSVSAVEYLPASIVGILNNMHPLWVAIGSVLYRPSGRPAWLIAGSLVALAGVVLVFVPDLLSGTQSEGLSSSSGFGVVLALTGSGVIAMSTVLGRHVMPDSDPLAVTALASGAAILPVSLLTLVSGGIEPILTAPPNVLLLLLYLGAGCTAANFALWYYGLKYVPAAAASAFQYLIPPVGVALAAFFLHEPLTIWLVLGTLLVLVGLALTQGALAGTAGVASTAQDDAVAHDEGVRGGGAWNGRGE